MLLKRHFRHKPGCYACLHPQAEVPHELERNSRDQPLLKCVEVKHVGRNPVAHLSAKLVDAAIAEGWAKIENDSVIMMTVPEYMRYTIVRGPGRYRNPDEPSGYEIIHYYDCVLDPQLFAKYRLP